MRTSPPSILPVFRSEMQMRLLGALLLPPTQAWTMQDLATVVGAPASSVHRELERALAAGIVERDAASRPHRYSAATDSPFYQPLSSLLSLSVGVEAELRDALAGLPIAAAVLHGSWVTGPLTAESDIDLLVVGEVDLREVRRRVRPVGKSAGRAIDVTVFSVEELSELARRRASFARHLSDDETRPIIGDLSTIATT
jgi:predicted nucleotidyltransferase